MGLVFHYREAYHGDENDRVLREYEKLKMEARPMAKMKPKAVKKRGRREAKK
jgi:hypothetical protein